MAEVVCAHGSDGLELTGVITAVDPALVLPCLANGDDLVEVGLQAAPTDQRTVGDTWARQLEYAPVLALVESEEADEQDTALLAQLHPTARQVTVGSGNSPPRPSRDSMSKPPPQRSIPHARCCRRKRLPAAFDTLL